MLIVVLKRHGGVRRDANGAGDLFAPTEIREKVLPEVSSRHAWRSVAVEGNLDGSSV
jgi:hypothetical protein